MLKYKECSNCICLIVRGNSGNEKKTEQTCNSDNNLLKRTMRWEEWKNSHKPSEEFDSKYFRNKNHVRMNT